MTKIISGFFCPVPECKYISSSEKRMKNHLKKYGFSDSDIEDLIKKSEFMSMGNTLKEVKE